MTTITSAIDGRQEDAAFARLDHERLLHETSVRHLVIGDMEHDMVQVPNIHVDLFGIYYIAPGSWGLKTYRMVDLLVDGEGKLEYRHNPVVVRPGSIVPLDILEQTDILLRKYGFEPSRN